MSEKQLTPKTHFSLFTPYLPFTALVLTAALSLGGCSFASAGSTSRTADSGFVGISDTSAADSPITADEMSDTDSPVTADEMSDTDSLVTSNVTSDEIIRCIRSGEWPEDTSVKEYTDSNSLGFYYQINIYRDDDLIYVIYNPEGGMSQIDADVLYSTDGGDTWTSSHYHNLAYGSSIYFGDGVMYQMIGNDFLEIGTLYLSYDMGETWEAPHIPSFAGSDIVPIEEVKNLPVFRYKSINISLNGGSHIADSETGDMHDCLMIGYTLEDSDYSCTDGFCAYHVDFSNGRIIFQDDPLGILQAASTYTDTQRLFPNSNTLLLEEDEVRARFLGEYTATGADVEAILSEIRLAINEIYAAKGYDFSGTSYEDYFSDLTWYQPVSGKIVGEEDLTSCEKANIDLLAKLEKEYKDMRTAVG